MSDEGWMMLSVTGLGEGDWGIPTGISPAGADPDRPPSQESATVIMKDEC